MRCAQVWSQAARDAVWPANNVLVPILDAAALQQPAHPAMLLREAAQRSTETILVWQAHLYRVQSKCGNCVDMEFF